MTHAKTKFDTPALIRDYERRRMEELCAARNKERRRNLIRPSTWSQEIWTDLLIGILFFAAIIYTFTCGGLGGKL